MKLSEQYEHEVTSQVKALEDLAAQESINAADKLLLQRGARQLIELMAKREVALRDELDD